MNKNIFIVYDDKLYFYNKEKQCQSIKVPSSITKKILYYFILKFKIILPKIFLSNEILSAEKIIITDAAFNISLYKRLTKIKGSEKVILYYMNTIDKYNYKYLSIVKNIYTFDKADAKKYNLNYLHTPYSSKIQIKNKKNIYDTIFLGRSKGRIEEITAVKNFLDSKDLINKFMVLDCEKKDMKIHKFIDYEEYLKLIELSKCIVDITLKNQTGCTLRFMESIFLKKKFITNNKNIIDDPYYCNTNVYILGEDKRDVRTFINEPYIESNQYLKDLDFENWMKGF